MKVDPSSAPARARQSSVTSLRPKLPHDGANATWYSPVALAQETPPVITSRDSRTLDLTIWLGGGHDVGIGPVHLSPSGPTSSIDPRDSASPDVQSFRDLAHLHLGFGEAFANSALAMNDDEVDDEDQDQANRESG